MHDRGETFLYLVGGGTSVTDDTYTEWSLDAVCAAHMRAEFV